MKVDFGQNSLRNRSPIATVPAVYPVPNRRAVPQVALWTGIRPRTIRSAQETGRWTDPSIVPTSQKVAEEFVLDARDKDRALPPFPRDTDGYDEVLRYWRIVGACGK